MGRVRDLAKQLPWGMRKIAALLATHQTKLLWGRHFRGVYHSFDDLPRRYPDDIIARYALANARTPKIDDATGLPILQQDHSLLPVIAAVLSNSSPLRILDYGGGAGIDFTNLNRALSPALLKYTVVELPALCAAGRELWQNDDRIEFRSDLPAANESFDLVYSWGAVYLDPEPLKVLEALTRYRPKAILLAHTPMTSRAAFVRGQTTSGVAFPSWVLSLADIKRVMESSGYRIASHTATFSDYNVDGYAPEFSVPNCASVLLLPESHWIRELSFGLYTP